MKSPKVSKPKWVRQAERVKNVSKLVVGKKIGDGSFAAVYSCTLRKSKSKQTFALKEIDRHKINQQGILKQVETERDVLFAVGEHSNIVRLYAYWMTNSSIYFLMEMVADGDLFDHVMTFAKAKKSIPDRNIANYMRQIAQGLEFIHDKNIIYRDLKLENILLHKAQDTLVFADFGLSKKLPPNERTKTICGTIQYMAPELLNDEPYGQDIDWWSLGVIAFILITGRYPYSKGHGVLQYDCSASDRYIMYKRICAGDVMFPDTMGETMMTMLQQLLHKNPELRLKSTEALTATPWFRATLPALTTENNAGFATPPRKTTKATELTPATKTPSAARRMSSFLFRRRSTQPRSTRGARSQDASLSSATTPRRRKRSSLRLRRSSSSHNVECEFDNAMIANPMREFTTGTSLATELEREAAAAALLPSLTQPTAVDEVLPPTRASAELPDSPPTSTSPDEILSPTDPDRDLPQLPPVLRSGSAENQPGGAVSTPAHATPAEDAFTMPSVPSVVVVDDDLPTALDEELPPPPPTEDDDAAPMSGMPTVPSVLVASVPEPNSVPSGGAFMEETRADGAGALLHPEHHAVRGSGRLTTPEGTFGDEDSFIIADTSPLSSRGSSPTLPSQMPETPPAVFPGRPNTTAFMVAATSNVGSGGARQSKSEPLSRHRQGSLPTLGLGVQVPGLPSAKSERNILSHASPQRAPVVRPVATPTREPYKRRGSRRNIPKTINPADIKESTAI
eukprot:m.654879 g.654879  ORF g.654879 m.654879 type:complete len:738 (-) comp22693_c0_seq3:251-2464(-)